MPRPSKQNSLIPPWMIGGLILLVLSLLSIWTWQKWDTVWVERSESFFPPEWQTEGTEAIETLAWQYPIYRSNDTYQWVSLADSLARGDYEALRYRTDEGTLAGRSNAWHSGLARVLHRTGALYATTQHEWTTQRGIHHVAHWLGAVILLITIALGYTFIYRLSGQWPAALFAGLYFFNAAINWDFAFSRLDHESVFQLCLLVQVLGVIGLLTANQAPAKRWAFLAGLGTAGCWWVSATVQIAVSALLMLGCLWALYRQCPSDQKNQAPPILTWGGTAAIGILLACILEQRNPLAASLSALHPIFILAQLGVCAVCLAATQTARRKQLLYLGLGLAAGLTPLIWIGIHQEAAHVWFDPLLRRVHHFIVEFQSPFKNGTWKQGIFLQSILIVICLISTQPWRQHAGRILLIPILGLLLLALLQTRWLGLLASLSTIGLCLAIPHHSKKTYLNYIAGAILLILMGNWAKQWKQIETNPGRVFVADMFLQVGARDINLNLNRLGNGSANVAIPYAFSASSALFQGIRPLGTLYWENREGIAESAALFASNKDSDSLKIIEANDIRFLAVQAGPFGQPFVEMTTWTALADDANETKANSLAWRLSSGVNLPEWCEPAPFYATFPPDRFPVRLYKIKD